MKLFFKFLFVPVLFFSCNGQNSKSINTIEPKTFSELIIATPDAQILDVRTPQEFELSHIDKAKNFDWFNENFSVEVNKLDKAKPVFVYCKSGGRSKNAAEKLEELGFKTIYNLQGGILKWDVDGFSKPTETSIGLSKHEFEQLLHSDKKILVNFYAEWCAPCKKMAPYLLKMQRDETSKVAIIRLNADENPSLIKELKIDALPTLILYEAKVIKWKFSGYLSETYLISKLQ